MSLARPPVDQAARNQFYDIPIADVRRETDDAVSIAFEIPPNLSELFRFDPGQYLVVRTTVDGEDLRRSYSISSAAHDGEWRIAVKKVDGGIFSAFATERLKAGDLVQLMPPAGRFVLPPAEGARTIVAFAAGSGITPISSQIRTVLQDEPEARVFLFYGNQTSRSIIFRDAFDDLKDRYVDRFSLHNILSREAQDVEALNGRIDGEKVALFTRTIVPLDSVDYFLVCGPAPFLNGVVDTLKSLGVPKPKLLLERFTTPKGRPPVEKPAEAVTERVEVGVTLDGVTTAVALHPGDRILDAALRAGLDAPYSCRAGMCCTCRAKVTHGAVAMDTNYSLRDEEVAAGFVLTCQSVPQGSGVTVDYDEA